MCSGKYRIAGKKQSFEDIHSPLSAVRLNILTAGPDKIQQLMLLPGACIVNDTN
jgi:hypothetical protein